MAHKQESVRVIIKFREYSVETVSGELVSYFTWKELMKFFKGIGASTIHAQVHRWDNALLMGKYIVTEVEYFDECLITPKGVVRLP